MKVAEPVVEEPIVEVPEEAPAQVEDAIEQPEVEETNQGDNN